MSCGMGSERRASIQQYYRPMHALLTHQRHDGDSINHTAARSGSIEVVQMTLRHIFLDTTVHYFEDHDLHSDEAILKAMLANGRLDVYEGAIFISSLVFMLKLNGRDRTAAEEARALGHNELATWLDEAVNFIYRCIKWFLWPGKPFDESNLQLWREGVERDYGVP